LSQVSVGIIGFGTWVREAYVPVLLDLPEVRVAAVAARSETSRTAAREVLGEQVALYPDYRDLLADSTLDAVMIAVPNRVHSEVLVAAAQSRKALFFEPPLGLTDAEVEAALAALTACEAPVQADFELRHTPVVQRVRQMVAGGLVGELCMVRVRLWCNWGHGGGPWLEEVQGQGFFPWLGYWYLDVLDAVIGDGPTTACLRGGKAMNGDLTDHGLALLTYPGGGLGLFDFSLIATEAQVVTLSVGGTAGEIEADLWSGDCRLRAHGGEWEDAPAPCAQPIHGFSGMRESIGAFIAAVAHGSPLLAGPDVIRRVHAAAWACARSDSEGVCITGADPA